MWSEALAFGLLFFNGYICGFTGYPDQKIAKVNCFYFKNESNLFM